MTVLAIGTWLLIIAAMQTKWQAPKIFKLGQRSYEIYLMHMFAVVTFFAVFVQFGKPSYGVPVLFVAAMAVAGFLGWLVAIFFAEPMNRLIRKRAGLDRAHVGAATPQKSTNTALQCRSGLQQFTNKRRKAHSKEWAFRELCRRSPSLPHTYACSTIGPTRLNFRVRDGNGWNPRGKLTGKL